MSIRHNSAGINPDAFPTLPEKVWFYFKIVEAEEQKSKRTNYDMVKLRCEVINNPEWNGTSVFHYVTFIPKGLPGDGISVHFRKSCGLPYGGDDVIEEEDWLGKKFKATTMIEEYEGKRNSKIKLVDMLDAVTALQSNEDDPFSGYPGHEAS